MPIGNSAPVLRRFGRINWTVGGTVGGTLGRAVGGTLACALDCSQQSFTAFPVIRVEHRALGRA